MEGSSTRITFLGVEIDTNAAPPGRQAPHTERTTGLVEGVAVVHEVRTTIPRRIVGTRLQGGAPRKDLPQTCLNCWGAYAKTTTTFASTTGCAQT